MTAAYSPSRLGGLVRRCIVPVGLTITLAGPVLAAGTALAFLRPNGGDWLAVQGALGLLGAAATAALLLRCPWLAPWGGLLLFCSSDELRLRLDPVVGVAKDVYVVLLAGLLFAQLIRGTVVPRRLLPLTGPLIALGVLVGLYVINPAGGHGGSWFYGARLLLEVLALLLLGMLCAQPGPTTTHLVRAMTVILPLEAALAWLQQAVGVNTLVYQWGYQYGAQVRVSGDGGLRTSGSFEDPFQLAALAVLGLVLALFVANRRQAVLLVLAATAIFAATSVRTAAFQVGVLLLVWAVRHGWHRQAAALVGAALLAGFFTLATTSASPQPGAPSEPLLFTLNGRTTAWAQSVPDARSFLIGNGVGERGSGSTRADQPLISRPPVYDPTAAPTAYFAGESGFLDSSYAQVQSDVGIVGTLAMLGGMLALAAILARTAWRYHHPAAWAACAVLVVSMIDWIGRSSLASYTTGFLTMYVLGVLIAASGASSPGPKSPGATSTPRGTNRSGVPVEYR